MRSFYESRPSPGVSAPFLPGDSGAPCPWQTWVCVHHTRSSACLAG